MASDERIPGDGGFVEATLKEAEQQLSARQRYQAAGIGLNKLACLVGKVLEIDPAQVRLAGKQPERVRARSLFCYWAVLAVGRAG